MELFWSKVASSLSTGPGNLKQKKANIANSVSEVVLSCVSINLQIIRMITREEEQHKGEFIEVLVGDTSQQSFATGPSLTNLMASIYPTRKVKFRYFSCCCFVFEVCKLWAGLPCRNWKSPKPKLLLPSFLFSASHRIYNACAAALEQTKQVWGPLSHVSSIVFFSDWTLHDDPLEQLQHIRLGTVRGLHCGPHGPHFPPGNIRLSF